MLCFNELPGASGTNHQRSIDTNSLQWDEFQSQQVYLLRKGCQDYLYPAGRPATSLTLLYPNQDVSVAPPTDAELNLLEREIINRAESAGSALQQTPAPAIPSRQNCSYCFVRQMCDAYWSRDVQQQLMYESDPQNLSSDAMIVDLEIDKVERQTPTIWKATALNCRALLTNTPVIIRAGSAHTTVTAVLESNEPIRIIDALLSIGQGDENPVRVITLTKFSEAFIVG